MTTVQSTLEFASGEVSIEELIGLTIDPFRTFDIYSARFNNSDSINSVPLNADYFYDVTLGLELELERATLGIIDVSYPIDYNLDIPESVVAGETFEIITDSAFSVNGATLTGETLNFGELGLNFTFQSGAAGITDISLGNAFGVELLPVDAELLFPAISETPVRLITVSASASNEVEVADGVDFIAKSPEGEEDTSDAVSGGGGSLPSIALAIEEALLSISINPLEILDDFPPLRALDVLTEDFGPASFSIPGLGTYEAEFEYTLLAPFISGGYGLVQSFSFIPDAIETVVEIAGEVLSGAPGEALGFTAPDDLTEPLAGTATHSLGGSVEVAYSLAPIGSIGVEILSAEGSVADENGTSISAEIGPVFEGSLSGSTSFGSIPLFDPISFELPEGFFDPIEITFEIPPVENTLSFVQDFVVGTTQDTSFSFDLERTGDTTFPLTVFVDGEVTTGNASFGDFNYTFDPGPNPELVIPASVSEVFGDVAGPIEITLVPTGPESETVQILDGTATYLLIGDRVDDRGGTAFGDPHLLSFDNVAFDFQAAGEFVLARATSGPHYEVQARFVALSSAISVTQAMATTVDGATISLQTNGAEGLLEIDGVETPLDDGVAVSVGSGSVSRTGRTIEIDHGNGDITSVDVFSTFLNVAPQPSLARDPGTMEGLLGNANGTPADDFRLADGTVLTTPVPVEILYGDFAAGWTLPEEDSLLPGAREEYDAPDRIITIDSLPATLRANAEAAVDAQAITNPILREAAILDFALTGNSEFIEAAFLVDQIFNPIVDTVPVDPVRNPVVILTSDSNTLNEEDPLERSATLTVSRGDTEGDLTVNYEFSGIGTAPADSTDFVDGIISGSVLIADGDETATFQVEIVDDETDEGPEVFEVAISLDAAEMEDFELLVSSVRMTVEDDDEPPRPNTVLALVEFQESPGRDNAVASVDGVEVGVQQLRWLDRQVEIDAAGLTIGADDGLRWSPDFVSTIGNGIGVWSWSFFRDGFFGEDRKTFDNDEILSFLLDDSTGLGDALDVSIEFATIQGTGQVSLALYNGDVAVDNALLTVQDGAVYYDLSGDQTFDRVDVGVVGGLELTIGSIAFQRLDADAFMVA